MNYNTASILENYIDYCKMQKMLDEKTLKAYHADLVLFSRFFDSQNICTLTVSDIESYVGYLNQNFKPKTVKRKIASIKAFFHHLEYKDIIKTNPFNKVRLKFREPLLLPKTIPLYTVEAFLSTIYKEHSLASTTYRQKRTLLDIAIIETLFSTGIRISELCNLKISDVNLYNASIRIYGKGSKERMIQLGNNDVIHLLESYKNSFRLEIQRSEYFFTNPNATPVSDQSVRRMINKYCSLAAIDLHITPHMFRHPYVKHTTKNFSLRLMNFQA